MPPIVNDRVARSVGLSVDLSPSEPCREIGSDRDNVSVQDLGGPRGISIASEFSAKLTKRFPWYR